MKSVRMAHIFYKRGIALITVLGVLTILTLVGVTFALNAIFENKIAWSYVYTVKAKYLAEAGIARAIAELKYGAYGARRDALDTTGEGWNAGYNDNSSPILTGGNYAVSIIDCARRINLNHNSHLLQILRNLNTVLEGTYGSKPLTDDDCIAIASNAPYTDSREIRSHLSGDQNAKYSAIAPFITIFGYSDPKVVNPQDVGTEPFEAESRSPININTADRRVIQAVLMGLKGTHVCPNCGGDGRITSGGGTLSSSCTNCDGHGNLSITDAEAAALALYIAPASGRRFYSSWSDFYYKKDGSVESGIKKCASIGPYDADLVMANANPNTGFSWVRDEDWAYKLGAIGKYVIDWDKDHNVDWDETNLDIGDAGLISSTTEFSFNSGGYYEITSTGSCNGARKIINAVIKIFDIYRDTSQEDFEKAGSARTGVDSYPEPTSISGASPAEYDGRMAIGRITFTTPNSGTFFRAGYQGEKNAAPDAAGGDQTKLVPMTLTNAGTKPPDYDSPPDYDGTSTDIGSVCDFSGQRGCTQVEGLLVDYFHKQRPYYYPVGKISPDAGTLEIWFKPKFLPNDDLMYGDRMTAPISYQHRLLRITSNSYPSGTNHDDHHPYITLFLYTENGNLCGNLVCDGFFWDDIADFSGDTEKWWDFAGKEYPPNSKVIEHFDTVNNQKFTTDNTFTVGNYPRGSWMQCVITWKNASPNTGPYPVRAIKCYINNNIVVGDIYGTDGYYYYHTAYSDSGSPAKDYSLEIGFEEDAWTPGSAGLLELSNSIIGSVRIWDSEFSRSDVNTLYNFGGVYLTSGTYTSAAIQPSLTGGQVEWGTISWTTFNRYTGIEALADIQKSESGSFVSVASAGGTPINNTGNYLRYRLRFNANTRPSLHPAILDDVTVTYLPKTQFLYYQEQ